jgi:hypothetical protein
MIKHMSKRTVVNGVNLHYVVAGEGPVVLGMRGCHRTSANSCH